MANEINITDESLKIFDYFKVGSNQEHKIFTVEIKTKEPWVEIKRDVEDTRKFFVETDKLVHNLIIPDEEMFTLPDEEYVVTKKDSKFVTTFFWIPLELVRETENKIGKDI